MTAMFFGSFVLGCGQAPQEEVLTITGSTSFQPALMECARMFEESHAGVRVIVNGGGSVAGVAAVLSGTAELGALSRSLSEEEQDDVFEFVPTVIAYDGIALVVNSENPVTNLTAPQIEGIFSGAIVNWKEVGGVEGAILPIRKNTGDGTQNVFEEHFELRKRVSSSMLTISSNVETLSTVERENGAIAFLSIGAVERAENSRTGVKYLLLDGVTPTVDNVKNRTYPLIRPLMLVSKGNPIGRGKEFIEFVLSPAGQKIMKREDFVPIEATEAK